MSLALTDLLTPSDLSALLAVGSVVGLLLVAWVLAVGIRLGGVPAASTPPGRACPRLTPRWDGWATVADLSPRAPPWVLADLAPLRSRKQHAPRGPF